MKKVEETTKSLGAAYDLFLLRDFSKLVSGLVVIVLWSLFFLKYVCIQQINFRCFLIRLQDLSIFSVIFLLIISYILGTSLQEIFSLIKFYGLYPNFDKNFTDIYPNYYIFHSELALRFPYSIRPLERIVVSKHFQSSIGIISTNGIIIILVKYFLAHSFLLLDLILVFLCGIFIISSWKTFHKKRKQQKEFIAYYFELLNESDNPINSDKPQKGCLHFLSILFR